MAQIPATKPDMLVVVWELPANDYVDGDQAAAESTGTGKRSLLGAIKGMFKR